jgi:hypothetical protein
MRAKVNAYGKVGSRRTLLWNIPRLNEKNAKWQPFLAVKSEKILQSLEV